MERAGSPAGSGSSAGARGRITVKALPAPGALSTRISPLIWSTRFLVMDMPSPVPAACRSLKRSSRA